MTPTPATSGRNAPAKHDSDGVWLYAPTQGYGRWRLVWVDPTTGKRPNRRFADRDLAVAAFDETVAWLREVLRYQPRRVDARDRPNGPIVDDLFEAADQRWALDGTTLRYRQRCAGLYRKWIQPVAGQLPVRTWMADSVPCLTVLHNARARGLLPASLQNIGALQRHLVTTAHKERWALRSDNPMQGVAYAARNSRRDGPAYVEPAERPTTTMVEALIGALDTLGVEQGLVELGLLAAVGAYGGLRFGEQTALCASSWCPTERRLWVDQAWSHPRGVAPTLGPTKNGRAREVLVPASMAGRLTARAAATAAGGLLIPARGSTTAPLTEGAFRRLFIEAARRSGWPMAHPARPAIPYKNLRHHAATWMHAVAGMDWPEISHALGHHSVAFTQARYVLSAAGARDRNRQRMDEL